MKHRTFAAESPGPVSIRIDAGQIDVTVITDPCVLTATAAISGPARALIRSRARTRRDGTWHIIVPARWASRHVPARIRITTAPDGAGGANTRRTVTMTVTVPPGSAIDAHAGPNRRTPAAPQPEADL